MNTDVGEVVDRDLFEANFELPDWFEDETFYDFRNPGHPLRAISVCRPQIASIALEGWVPQQRERIANTRMYQVSEVEQFSNPRFPIQGFRYWDESEGAPPSVFVHATIGVEAECVTVLINAAADGLGFVHALLERVVPDLVNAPLEGWVWRRMFGVAVPVPEAASVPRHFQFRAEEARVSVNLAAHGAPVALVPLANDASIRVEPVLELLTSQGLRATALTASAVDATDQPVTLVCGLVESGKSSVVMTGRAYGDQRVVLERNWPRIVASAKFREA